MSLMVSPMLPQMHSLTLSSFLVVPHSSWAYAQKRSTFMIDGPKRMTMLLLTKLSKMRSKLKVTLTLNWEVNWWAFTKPRKAELSVLILIPVHPLRQPQRNWRIYSLQKWSWSTTKRDSVSIPLAQTWRSNTIWSTFLSIRSSSNTLKRIQHSERNSKPQWNQRTSRSPLKWEMNSMKLNSHQYTTINLVFMSLSRPPLLRSAVTRSLSFLKAFAIQQRSMMKMRD